ncbi:MAG: hypothetical protein Q9170_001400 [Blastenia crenularia]
MVETEYQFEHGRRYHGHKDAAYFMPNDESEVARLVYDAESKWDFAQGQSFDLIHSRFLVQGIHDWRGYFQKCLDHLNPGGWVEFHEVRYPMYSANPYTASDTPFLRWGNVVKEGLAKAGIDAGAMSGFSQYLRDVGFEDIGEEKINWAVGPWPDNEKEKKIEEMEEKNFRNGLEGMTMRVLTKNLGWTEDDVERFLADIQDDLDDLGKKYYIVV